MPNQPSHSGPAARDKKERHSPGPSGRSSESTIIGGETTILAEIPDLDAAVAVGDREPAAEPDGRVISQGLSNKLVIGGGIVLVLAAIFPFVFNRKGSPKPAAQQTPVVQPNTPAPSDARTASSGGLLPASRGQQLGNAPAPATSPGTGYEPARPNAPYTRSYLQPQPQAGTNRPMALSDPAWPQQGTPADAQDYRRNAPADSRSNTAPDPRPVNPPDYRSNDRGVAEPDLQADRRSEPASDYRNHYPGTGLPQGNPLMPAGNGSVAPPTSQGPQPPQPGVARFEGGIRPPPMPTNTNDRSGPSLH